MEIVKIIIPIVLLIMSSVILYFDQKGDKDKELFLQFWPTKENWRLQLQGYGMILVVVPVFLVWMFLTNAIFPAVS